jgi:hypothetical protein
MNSNPDELAGLMFFEMNSNAGELAGLMFFAL